jgi:hypothetical protein
VPGHVPGNHVFSALILAKGVNGRDQPGRDEG